MCLCLCLCCGRFLSSVFLDQFSALQVAAPWFQTSTEVIYIVERHRKGEEFTPHESARARARGGGGAVKTQNASNADGGDISHARVTHGFVFVREDIFES